MLQIEVCHTIPATANQVFPYFSELPRFVSVHPVIYNCKQINEDEFVLFEKLKITLFSIRFSYKVRMEKIIPFSKVVMSSEIIKGINLLLTFDFEQDGQATTITETVHFSGPAIIGRFFLPFLKRVHLQLADNLVAQLSKQNN